MVVLIAFDRYAAVCMPHRVQYRSLIRAKVAVLILFIITCTLPVFQKYGLERFIVTEIVEKFQSRLIIHFVFLFAGPTMTAIAIMNTSIIRVIQEKRRRRTDMNLNNRYNVTLMVVTVEAVFIVCQLPLQINKLMTFICVLLDEHVKTNDDYLSIYAHLKIIVYVTQTIVFILIILNSSINFLIYCLVGKKFRQIVVEMIPCRRFK